MDVVCGGSITSKIAREANQLFEELIKNNYQTPYDRSSIGKINKKAYWRWIKFPHWKLNLKP